MTCDCYLCTDVKPFRELVETLEMKYWPSLTGARNRQRVGNTVTREIPVDVMIEAYDAFEKFFKERTMAPNQITAAAPSTCPIHGTETKVVLRPQGTPTTVCEACAEESYPKKKAKDDQLEFNCSEYGEKVQAIKGLVDVFGLDSVTCKQCGDKRAAENSKIAEAYEKGLAYAHKHSTGEVVIWEQKISGTIYRACVAPDRNSIRMEMRVTQNVFNEPWRLDAIHPIEFYKWLADQVITGKLEPKRMT